MPAESATSAAAIAANAQEKLASSARKLFRNGENLSQTAHSLEAAFRTVFGACTNGNSPNVVSPENDLKLVTTSGSNSSEKDLPIEEQGDYGEHIYAQLFLDDEVKAARAVKKQHTQRRVPASPLSPRPFPVSSPLRKSPAPLSSELNIPQDYDDGISAISAHTLEAMENKFTKQQSTGVASILDDVHFVKASPSPMRREPSTKSKNSHSTRTTESSTSFEHMWNQQEAKFWQDQVQQDERRHPHDTFPHDTFPGSRRRDPDRIAQCLENLPADTELAEI